LIDVTRVGRPYMRTGRREYEYFDSDAFRENLVIKRSRHHFGSPLLFDFVWVRETLFPYYDESAPVNDGCRFA
jgi:hypothetical protein